jgi:hypothetical protein
VREYGYERPPFTVVGQSTRHPESRRPARNPVDRFVPHAEGTWSR